MAYRESLEDGLDVQVDEKCLPHDERPRIPIKSPYSASYFKLACVLLAVFILSLFQKTYTGFSYAGLSTPLPGPFFRHP